MFLNCLEPEEFLELVSIPEELSFVSRISMKSHLAFCGHCKSAFQGTQRTWAEFLKPEPDITSSLLKVYSRLQSDETLILKGWKLDNQRRKKELSG
ncbi:hypothetical protein EBT16_08325, partial [bacterium]|nr:hypothetical protein [bacterium]